MVTSWRFTCREARLWPGPWRLRSRSTLPPTPDRVRPRAERSRGALAAPAPGGPSRRTRPGRSRAALAPWAPPPRCLARGTAARPRERLRGRGRGRGPPALARGAPPQWRRRRPQLLPPPPAPPRRRGVVAAPGTRSLHPNAEGRPPSRIRCSAPSRSWRARTSPRSCGASCGRCAGQCGGRWNTTSARGTGGPTTTSSAPRAWTGSCASTALSPSSASGP
mmetsp:Transcript_85829/g.265755  ORF Transcript_85829/g.265755 Transcript_85829/m.265755 type:complete len:221 (-) Transcript_85829:101-763(-)